MASSAALYRADGHAPSYYAATVAPTPNRPRLQGMKTCDVCIVGAGFTGMSAAIELVEKGFSVIVVEAEQVGWGASGRNGGQLVNGYSRSLDVIGRRYGADVEIALGAMALEGSGIIRDRVRRYAIDCDLVEGGFYAALTKKQLDGMRVQRDTWARHNHRALSIVEKADVPNIVASERYVGGMVDALGGHFHPLNYVRGEATRFELLKGQLFERSRVARVQKGKRPMVHTDKGVIACDILMLCGNAYLGDTMPELSGRIMPVSSQIIATEPLGGLAETLLPANYCVEDANFILDYFRRTPDGRILYGGGTVYGGQDPKSIRDKILPEMLKTFPGLKGSAIEFAWSGNFALTMTRVPQIGRLTPTIYYSHGDSGHGVTTTQLLGRLLAEAATSQMERFDVFAQLPYYGFPGGQRFRVPLTILGAWYYGLREKLGI